MDWTTLVIALFGAVGGVGIWQFMIVRARLDSKERLELSREWREMNDRLQATEQRWRADLDGERKRAVDLENRLSRLANQNAELQSQLANMAVENGGYRRQIQDLQNDKNKLTDRVRKLERILEDRGLDTGPLNQGVVK